MAPLPRAEYRTIIPHLFSGRVLLYVCDQALYPRYTQVYPTEIEFAMIIMGSLLPFFVVYTSAMYNALLPISTV